MTTGPLRLGAGFLVFTHRAFQGNAIWGEGHFVPASTRMDAPIRTIKATFPLPTNLATLRSFAFKPLSKEGRFAHFHRNFPEVELPIEAAERLARLERLTPGDFKVVLTRP